MITFNNIVERFEIFAENHFFIKTFSFGSPDDADLSKFTDFPLMHLVYTGANYDAGTKTYNIEVYILDVPADKNDKVERQKEVVSDAEQCAEDIIADIKNGGNIFLFAQDYEVVNATTTPLEEETKNVLSGVLLDLSVAIPYEWDACNAPIDGVEPGGTEVTYARRGVLRMLTIDGTTDVQSVRTINVTNGTLTDDGDGVVTLDTGGAETLNDLTDVDTTGVTDGQVLKYDNASGEWLPGNDQSATSLGNLDDVSIVTPANREALIYDGSEWVNDTVAKGDIGLGNVDNTSDADKPVSTATQTALNAKANTADVPTSLNDLSDVSIVGTPTGNQALIYDATANAFKSQVSYTNRFEDDVETGKQGITGTERAYSVKGEGDGVFADPESDTPAAGKVIVRKIYHKAGFITDADVIGDYTLIHTFADDTAYADTVATFEGFEDGATYGVPPFTLLQTWEEVAAAPTFTGLLNESYGSGAEAAYSTRRLNGNITDCMVIRRASDSTTQTIGFDGSGNIDESAINTFCSGTSCTVYQWLDQSGNGNTATAAAQANEPTIYTGGALVKENGKLALDFDGSNDILTVSNTASLQIVGDLYFANVIATEDTNLAPFFTKRVDDNNREFEFRNSSSTQFSYLDSANRKDFAISANLNRQLYSINRISNTSVDFNLDGYSFSAVSLTGTQATTSADVAIGARLNLSQSFNGRMQEILLYANNKSSDRTSIESNVGDYFTQNTPLLDTYTGAAACYSLRLMRTAYTGSAIRVRRSSDNTEQDIGFNVFGELDTVSLLAFAGAGDAFVKTWYDQSGNSNDATQTATGCQPKIVSSGAVIVENGKPAVEFDGSSNYIPLVSGALPSNINNASGFAVYTRDATSGSSHTVYSLGVPNTRWYGSYLYNSNNKEYFSYGTSFTVNEIQQADTNQHIVTNIAGSTQGDARAFLDGTLAVTASLQSATPTAGAIGSSNSTGSNPMDGTIQEFIVYHSDQSANRTNIESNINTFYSIY